MDVLGYMIIMLLFVFCGGLKGEIRKLRNEVQNLAEPGRKTKNRVDSAQLKEMVGKPVHLNIDNDDVENSHIFSSYTNVKGVILEMDEEWLLFEYEDGKKHYQQYLRVKDITSIEE